MRVFYENSNYNRNNSQDGAYLTEHLLNKRCYATGLLRDNSGINIKNIKYLEIDSKINLKR